MSDPCTRAASQFARGDTKRALSNISRCQKDLQSKIKKFKNNPEARESLRFSLAKAYRFEGQIYFSESNVGKAYSAFQSGLKSVNNLIKTDDTEALTGHILYSLGMIDFLRKNYELGITRFEEAKSFFFNADMAEQALEILLRLGNIHRDLNQLDEALNYYQEIDKNKKKCKDKDNRRLYEGRAKLEEGKLLWAKDQKKAAKLFKDSKKLFGKVKFDEGTAQVLIEQAKLQSKNPQKAKDYLLEARDIGSIADNDEIQGKALTQLGVISLKMGDFETGKDQLLRGLEYRTKAGDMIGTAQTLVELSRITLITASKEEEVKNSLKFANQGLEIYRDQESEYGTATTLELLGSINTKLSQFDVAKSQLQEAKSLFAKYNDDQGEARVLTQLAVIYDQEGKVETAIPILEKAIQVFEKHENSQGAAEAYQLLGLQYRDNDVEKAVQYLTTSRDLYAEIIGDNSALSIIVTKIEEVISDLKGMM